MKSAYNNNIMWTIGAVGSASVLCAEGRGFEPHIVHLANKCHLLGR